MKWEYKVIKINGYINKEKLEKNYMIWEKMVGNL